MADQIVNSFKNNIYKNIFLIFFMFNENSS